MAAVGLEKRWARRAAPVPRADGHGEVPWTVPLNTYKVRGHISRVRTACVIALAALTGMRMSELTELPLDCRLPPEQSGEGRVRHRLKSKIAKGRGLGGSGMSG